MKKCANFNNSEIDKNQGSSYESIKNISHHRQMVIKLICNVIYGYFGAGGSGRCPV
jgi:DNA polymerase elongation subunit (family B)